MQSEVAELPLPSGDILEQVIIQGDLSKLTPQERVLYYRNVCQSLGLNPYTRPFDYVTYQGRMILYAKRDCADQLRRIHNISVEVVDRKDDGELLVVHARARVDRTGRKDEDFGAVAILSLKGEARANAIMKCVTKAKRRVTLSICGLGVMDETEVDDLLAVAKASVEPADTVAVLDQFAADGQPPEEETLLQRAQRSTLRGSDSYRDFFVSLTTAQRRELMPHHDALKEAAELADGEPPAVGR